jgi:hypothetical protein
LVYFFPFWYVETKKNLATLVQRTPRQPWLARTRKIKIAVRAGPVRQSGSPEKKKKKRSAFSAETVKLFADKMTAEANKERTFIMIKPDGVQRGLVGEILKRFEQKGFKLVAMKFMHVRTNFCFKTFSLHYRDINALHNTDM